MSEEKKENIYEEEGMEEAMDSDEIDEVEEGFMKGYEEKNMAECNTCGKVLVDYNKVIELEIDGETCRFCSEECAECFRQSKQKQ